METEDKKKSSTICPTGFGPDRIWHQCSSSVFFPEACNCFHPDIRAIWMGTMVISLITGVIQLICLASCPSCLSLVCTLDELPSQIHEESSLVKMHCHSTRTEHLRVFILFNKFLILCIPWIQEELVLVLTILLI